MHRMHLSMNLLFVLVLSMLGCAPAKPTLAEAALYARYDESSGKLSTTASFVQKSPEGKLSQTELPNVRVANAAMNRQSTAGGYQLDMQTQPLSPVTFTYTDWNKKDFLSEVPIRSSFPWKVTSASAKTGFFISWQGAPLGSDESLILMLENEQRQTRTCEIKGPSKESNLLVSPIQLPDLTAGEWNMYVVHKREMTKTDNDLTVIMNAEFYTNSTKVVFLP